MMRTSSGMRKMAKYVNDNVSRMRAYIVIITAMALVLCVAPALAADVTIPINKDVREGDMVVHILQVSITDQTMGNVYSPDPSNTVWPKLVFTYENKGKVPLNGNFEVAFYDDSGNQYPDKKHITDITMDPIQPGATSGARFVEAAVVPKNTKVTSFKVFVGGQATTFEIPYESASTTAPTSTGGQSTGQSTAGKGLCAMALVLPVLAVGIFLAGRIRR